MAEAIEDVAFKWAGIRVSVIAVYEALGYAAYAKIYDYAVKFTKDLQPGNALPPLDWGYQQRQEQEEDDEVRRLLEALASPQFRRQVKRRCSKEGVNWLESQVT